MSVCTTLKAIIRKVILLTVTDAIVTSVLGAKCPQEHLEPREESNIVPKMVLIIIHRSETSQARSDDSTLASGQLQNPSFLQDDMSRLAALQSSLGEHDDRTPPVSSYEYAYQPLGFDERPESLPTEDSSMTIEIDSHSTDLNQDSQQRTEPASERFEAFVGDNFGEFAPRFAQQEGRKNSSISSPFPSSESQPRFEVDLGSRSTIDIERQFINLDSEDMDYLRAKGKEILHLFPTLLILMFRGF
jgi:hypothetical protein